MAMEKYCKQPKSLLRVKRTKIEHSRERDGRSFCKGNSSHAIRQFVHSGGGGGGGQRHGGRGVERCESGEVPREGGVALDGGVDCGRYLDQEQRKKEGALVCTCQGEQDPLGAGTGDRLFLEKSPSRWLASRDNYPLKNGKGKGRKKEGEGKITTRKKKKSQTGERTPAKRGKKDVRSRQGKKISFSTNDPCFGGREIEDTPSTVAIKKGSCISPGRHYHFR